LGELTVNECKVTFHPAFVEAAKGVAELEEERWRLQTIMNAGTFERVRRIVEAQPARKRAAYYGTICEAARAGQDFSHVETLEDIADIYARFIIGRAFGD